MAETTDEFAGVEFACPSCGETLDRFHETCPACGCGLSDEYCATYRPRIPVAVKIIAIVFLVGLFLVPLALFIWSLFA